MLAMKHKSQIVPCWITNHMYSVLLGITALFMRERDLTHGSVALLSQGASAMLILP